MLGYFTRRKESHLSSTWTALLSWPFRQGKLHCARLSSAVLMSAFLERKEAVGRYWDFNNQGSLLRVPLSRRVHEILTCKKPMSPDHPLQTLVLHPPSGKEGRELREGIRGRWQGFLASSTAPCCTVRPQKKRSLSHTMCDNVVSLAWYNTCPCTASHYTTLDYNTISYNNNIAMRGNL